MSQYKGLELFEKELSLFEANDVQAFTSNAIVAAPKSFWEDEDLVAYTKKVFYIVKHLLEKDQVPTPIKDVILSGTLLCDIAQNETEEENREYHPINAMKYLKKVQDDLNPQLLEAVQKIILSHEGEESPIKQLEPKPGGPEHLVVLAHRIAQADFIQINV